MQICSGLPISIRTISCIAAGHSASIHAAKLCRLAALGSRSALDDLVDFPPIATTADTVPPGTPSATDAAKVVAAFCNFFLIFHLTRR